MPPIIFKPGETLSHENYIEVVLPYAQFEGNMAKRYFKATYFIPNNPGNQAGIIGQAMEQISNAPWKPIFFWMAWSGKGIELSVYPEIGPNPIIKRITDVDPRGKMHTIEM
ncbi:unnamed protein product [Rotaria sp. Silwood2]|nr:unnamed protein product [Rotaria sp. Silwood2]CAF4674916.1 unnamed protein product [Rotaria sp. Silwood2]